MNERLVLLRHQLSLAFDRRSWHGPNLLGSLRGVKPPEAIYRPQRGRHNIAELVVHCAYWKYRVCRLLAPEQTRAFELDGSDWFPRDAVTGEVWKTDMSLLKRWHADLVSAVEQLDPRTLDERRRAPFDTAELISGAAAHDLYHAGQIRLLRRMCGGRMPG